MTFTEAWMSESSCFMLARLVRRTRGLDGRVVEVGCWEGKSTSSIAQAAYPDVVHAVDTWRGSPGEPSEALAAERDVYARFVENMAALTRGNVEPHRMGWRDYFAADQTPIRFLHIDATHTYEEVRDNILAALPMMVKGAIIAGDDAHDEDILRGVGETLGMGYTISQTLWYEEIGSGSV